MTPNRITMRVLEDSLPKDKERYLDGQRFWGAFLGYLKRINERRCRKH